MITRLHVTAVCARSILLLFSVRLSLFVSYVCVYLPCVLKKEKIFPSVVVRYPVTKSAFSFTLHIYIHNTATIKSFHTKKKSS